MDNAHALAVDVFRAVCGRLAGRADELGRLAAADAPFDGWLDAEAYLACRARRADPPFGEVTARPTYGSEGVAGPDGRPAPERGGLLVGGVGGPGHHQWVFAEFVLLFDRPTDGRARIEAAADRLLRLGWKRSAALLVVVAAGPDDVGDDLATLPAWQRPPVCAPARFALPGGGSAVIRAFDVKRDPADTLTPPAP